MGERSENRGGGGLEGGFGRDRRSRLSRRISKWLLFGTHFLLFFYIDFLYVFWYHVGSHFGSIFGGIFNDDGKRCDGKRFYALDVASPSRLD